MRDFAAAFLRALKQSFKRGGCEGAVEGLNREGVLGCRHFKAENGMIGETEVVNIDERAVDWAQIEGEYVTGKDSLKTLSERYGLALKTVKKHSAAGKWSEKRKKFAAKRQSASARGCTSAT